MKKLWKALGIAALAAVVPVRYKKDEETGKKTFQSLLWKLDVGPTGDGEATEIGLDLMEGVLTTTLMNTITAKKEAVLFADDDPDAAVIAADEAQAAADAAQTAADEAQAAADAAQAAADEAQAAEAVEADFDPEF